MTVSIDTVCCCGHEYGDHKAKKPHACSEESRTRPGYDCACEAFQTPAPHDDAALLREIAKEAGVQSAGVDHIIEALNVN